MKIPKLPRITLGIVMIVGGLIMVAGVVTVLGTMRYSTMNPSFCLTCHSKGEADVSVKSTIHPEKVGCIDCHSSKRSLLFAQGYPQGFSADDDVVNHNCKRCHEDIVAGKQVTFKYNVMDIQIPHKLHLEDVGAQCTDCHANIAHDNRSDITNRPHMERCIQCHTKSESTCNKCHKAGTIAPPRSSDISRTKCSTCHEGFDQKTYDIYDLQFPHQRHLARGINCNNCHNNMEKHGTIAASKNQCLECHHQKQKDVSCTQCHKSQASLFKGDFDLAHAGTSEAKPNQMYGQVKCQDCHDLTKKHSVEQVSGQCTNCHDASYAEVLKEWESDLKGQLTQLEKSIGKYEKIVQAAREAGKETKEAEKVLQKARENFKYVAKTKGVHNPDLIKAATTKFLEELEKIPQLIISKIS